ncbi:MAG: hypothetical protein M1130_07340 [Actinobacteria bacterium]|nr:hypothetical protein [Actinomycetota bacterium]
MKVNREQNLLIRVYLPLTFVIILTDHLFPGRVAVNYFKFVVVLTLFPAALLTGKWFREQVILTFAVFLMVVGDFFLNLCSAIPDLAGDVRIFGVLSFILAYLSLLAGLLILISDIGVANNVFNPAYSSIIVPWLQNIIWGTYIPAWTLMAVNIAENRLLA